MQSMRRLTAYQCIRRRYACHTISHEDQGRMRGRHRLPVDVGGPWCLAIREELVAKIWGEAIFPRNVLWRPWRTSETVRLPEYV